MPPKGDPFRKLKIVVPKSGGRGDEQNAELMKSFLEEYDDKLINQMAEEGFIPEDKTKKTIH